MVMTITRVGAADYACKTAEATLTAVGPTDWTSFSHDVLIQITGPATAATYVVERSSRDPSLDGVGNPAPVTAALNGNPSTGIPVGVYPEPGFGWWRVRLTALTGASAVISLASRGGDAVTAVSVSQPPALAFNDAAESALETVL